MLYKHQQQLLEKNPERQLLAWETGTGKSLASIEWARRNGTAMFVVPKSLLAKWDRDIEHEGFDVDSLILSKEVFRRDWKTLRRYDVIVVDEAHYFSGPTSAMSKALLNYIKKYKPRVLLLTATPYMSTPWNIYTLARHLGHNWNYMDFKQKFFQDRYIGRRVVPEVRPNMEKEIARLVSKIGDVVRLDECVDVPPQVFETEYYKLTPEQEKAKKELVQEVNPIVRFTKYHEIENGILKDDGYTQDKYFDCDKMERIEQLCRENKKIAIVCRYNIQIRAINKMLGMSDLRMKNLYGIQGMTKNKDAVVRAIAEDQECIVLINAACSEGYELPSVNTWVFASLDFSYKNYKQMCGRSLRINNLKKNVYIHLVSEGVDTDVYKAIMNKQSFDIAIYAQNN